jgi:hypothetical protein
MDFSFGDFKISLEDGQYVNLLHLIDRISRYNVIIINDVIM